MKNLKLASLIAVIFLAASCGQQTQKAHTHEGEAEKKTEITKEQLAQGVEVEAACGQCIFELPGEGCDLAVRINGQAYYVDGAKMDHHGDAHAEDGMCNALRHAKVKGQVVDGRFKAEAFELLAAHHDHGHDHGDHGHSHDDNGHTH